MTSTPVATAAAAAASGRARALALYRDILRAHRSLPPAMRDLGDAYVREEFRRHQSAKPQFLAAFFREWERYLDECRAVGKVADGVTVGRDLSRDAVAGMTEDQQQQLVRLRREVETAASGAAPLR